MVLSAFLPPPPALRSTSRKCEVVVNGYLADRFARMKTESSVSPQGFHALSEDFNPMR